MCGFAFLLLADSSWIFFFCWPSEEVEVSEEEGEDPALDSLSQAIAFQVLMFSRDQWCLGT